MKYLQDEDEAKDALMQIFEKLLVDLKKHEITQFKGWLHMVAKNHCLMQLRSDKALQGKQQELKKDFKSVVESGYELHLNSVQEKEQQLTQLEEAIKKLNEEQKLCIDLFYLKEKSYQEIVELTGFSLNSVKSNIQNGKRNIKIHITGKA